MKSVAVLVAVCFIQCIAGEPLFGLFGGGSRHHSSASASAHASSHGHGGGGLLGGILPGGDDCDGGLLGGLPVVGGIVGGDSEAHAEAHAHSDGGGGILGGVLGGDDCDGGDILGGLPVVGGLVGGGSHAEAHAEAHSGGDGGILGGVLGGDDCDGGGILGGLPVVGGLVGGGSHAEAHAEAHSGGDGGGILGGLGGGILGGIGGGVIGGIGGGVLGGCDGGGVLGGLGGVTNILGNGGVLGGLGGGILNGGIIGGLGGEITSFPKLICQTVQSSVTTITTQVTRYVTITKTVLPIIEQLPVISDLAPSLGVFDQLSDSLTPAFNTIGSDADDCSSIIGHGTQISPALQDVHSGVQNLIQTTRNSYTQSSTTTIVQVRQQIEVVIRRLFTYISNCRLTVRNVYTYINHDDVTHPALATGLAAIGKLTTGIRTTLQITTTFIQKITQVTNIRSTELIGTTKYLDQVTTRVQTLETSLSRCTSITNVRPVLASVLGDLNDISTGIVSQPCFNVQPNNVYGGPIGPAGVIQQTTQAVSQTTQTRTVLQRVVTTLGHVSTYIVSQVQQVSTRVTTINYTTIRTHFVSLQNVIYRVLNRFAFLPVHRVQSVYTEVTAYYSQITSIIKSLSTTIDSCDATILKPYLVVFQQFFQSIVYITQVTYRTFQTVYGTTVTTTTTVTEQQTVQILQTIESRLTAINIGGSIGGPGGVIISPNGPDDSSASAAASATSGPYGSTATAVASASSGPHGGHIYPHGPGPVQILDTDDNDDYDNSPTVITESPDNEDDDVSILPVDDNVSILPIDVSPHHTTTTASASASATSYSPHHGPIQVIDTDDNYDQPQPTIITESPDCDDDVTIQPVITPHYDRSTTTASASASASSSGPHGVHIYPHGPGPVVIDSCDNDQSPTIVTDEDDSYPTDYDYPHGTSSSAAAAASASAGPHGASAAAAASSSSSGPHGVHVYHSGPAPVEVVDNDDYDDQSPTIIHPIHPHVATASASAVATSSDSSPVGVYPTYPDYDNESPVTILPIDRHPRGVSSASASASATAGNGYASASATASATSDNVIGPYATLFNTYRRRLVSVFESIRTEITTISQTVTTSYDHTIIITQITKVQTLISNLVQYISQLDTDVVHSRICPVTFNSGIQAITTVTKEISVTINEYIQSGSFTEVITKRLYRIVQQITAYSYYPTYYTTNILRRITTSDIQVTTIVPTVLKNLITSFSSVSSISDTSEYQDNGLQPYITGLDTCGNELSTVPIDTSEVSLNQVEHIRQRIAGAVEGVHQVRNSFDKVTSNVQSIQQRAVVLASAVSDITQDLTEVTADNEELRRNLDESLCRLQAAIADSNNLGIYNHFATYHSGSSSSASASASASSDGSSASAAASASSSSSHPYHIVLDNGNRFCNTIRHYNRWLPQPLPC